MAFLSGLSLVAVLLCGAWGGVDWYLMTGPGADRTVPLVTGTPLGDAEAELAASDLAVHTEERFDDGVPAGHVISAEPSTGTTLKRGEEVRLVVSKGVETFPVPALEGTELEAAREEVEALGLELVEDDPEHSETVPKGVVMSQSADAEALPAGGEVHVVVSQGRQPLSVPDQTGAPADSAIDARGRGVPRHEREGALRGVPSGSVISRPRPQLALPQRHRPSSPLSAPRW